MQLGMLLGTDSGILGIGAPEVVVTLLVGYFILGPSELYKITKDIGKFIQNFRTLGSEATKSFETAMEDQLQMQEIRKAQRELNNAFSFRRSINVDQDAEAFAEPKKNDDLVADDMDGSTKKKKKRRIKRKVTVDETVDQIETVVPDLDMTDAFPSPVSEDGDLSNADATNVNRTIDPSIPPDMNRPEQQMPSWSEEEQNARFAEQLSGNWNQRILDNQENLSPLAQVMEKLALLEEEREMINQRLEEEFRLRKQNDEKFYQQKRALLENAAQQISTAVYGRE
jgi:Sec-independent protein translocase protein TatA